MKKIFTFACILLLVIYLCAVFSFAATPEAEETAIQEGVRAGGEYTVKKSSYLYIHPNINSAYACPSKLPVGHPVVRADTNLYNGAYFKITCNYLGGIYTGYILRTCLE